MTHYHPKKNDKGQLVELKTPHQPSPVAAWANSNQLATATPGCAMPLAIGEIDVRSWADAPTDSAGWERLAAASSFEEPAFKVAAGKKAASGAVIVEPDGRVWVVSPSNRHGGYKNTFPKGKLELEYKLSLRGNAHKEVFEEAGLHIQLTGFLSDSQRDTTTTRYYLARRLTGNPADMRWESQAVHLVPRNQLKDFVTHKNDLPLLEALAEKVAFQPTRVDILKASTLTSAARIVATVHSFRRQHGYWPNKVMLDKGMAKAIQEHVLTPLGWTMLATKLELVLIDRGTVIAEGRHGVQFEYDCDHSIPSDGQRADVWIWGIPLLD